MKLYLVSYADTRIAAVKSTLNNAGYFWRSRITSGGPIMALAKEDYQAMEEHVREFLSSWLAKQEKYSFVPIGEIEIRERIVRVEEELKNQRELMKQGFEQIDKRFEQIDKRFEQVDKRFEQVDKRFEEQRQDMMSRFEQVDARFEALTKRMDRFMIWSFGLTVSMAGVVIGVLKFT